MSAFHNSALRQSKSIRADLDAFSATASNRAEATSASNAAALQGQLTTSLTAFARTLGDYERAINTSQPTKGNDWANKERDRLTKFKSELEDYRQNFAELKHEREATQLAQTRGELFGQRRGGDTNANGVPENPYAMSSGSGMNAAVTDGVSRRGHGENVNPLFRTTNPNFVAGGVGSNTYSAYGGMSMNSDQGREDHALKESSFFSSTNSTLDEYIARGQAVLGDLGQQREVLKGTQRKLYSVGATLGISGDTIRMVNRRARQDKWIFWGGVIVFVIFCWLVLHYLR